MKHLIGSKSEFAIEYSIRKHTPYLMGNIIIWLDNHFLGYYDEEVMLLPIQNSLTLFVNRLDALENENYDVLSVSDLYQVIYFSDIDNGKYLLSLGESFDDFSIFGYKKRDNILIVWKLHDDPFFEYPNYSEEIHCKEISIAEFAKTINDFQSSLDSACP